MENVPETVENISEISENLQEMNTIDSLKSKRKYTMSDAKLEQLKIARQRASQVRKERAIERKENLKKSKEPEVNHVVEALPLETEEPIHAEEPMDTPLEEEIIPPRPTFTKNDNGVMILNF